MFISYSFVFVQRSNCSLNHHQSLLPKTSNLLNFFLFFFVLLFRNISTDSSDSLYCDPNLDDNTYIGSTNRDNIIRFNDLLPPLTKSGEIVSLPSFALSTFQPEHMIQTDSIQVHIQFSDRSYDIIQETLQRTTNQQKYQMHKKKKRRLQQIVNNPNIRQSKRIRNKLQKEIFDFDTLSSANGHTKKKKSKQKPIKQPPKPPTPNILNLPNLEPRKRAISEDSVSSMSVSLDIETTKNNKKRKANFDDQSNKNNKKRKLNGTATTAPKIFDNDVIGDSEDDFLDGAQAQNSLIYNLSLDDFKFDFFLSLFPQLLVTHHLVYCNNSYQHYYYQSHFSSDKNEYEWIQTDERLMDIFHKYINDHFIDVDNIDYNVHTNKYTDYQNRKIVLFFQIRPRADTCLDGFDEHDNQILLDNLYQINSYNHQIGHYKDDKMNFVNAQNAMIYIEDESDFDDADASMMDNCEDSLVSNVIKAILDQQIMDPTESEKESVDNDIPIAGSWESGLCAFCERKFSSNKCDAEEWIQCDECELWYHLMCSGLTNSAFAQYQNGDKHKKYKCLVCSQKDA